MKAIVQQTFFVFVVLLIFSNLGVDGRKGFGGYGKKYGGYGLGYGGFGPGYKLMSGGMSNKISGAYGKGYRLSRAPSEQVAVIGSENSNNRPVFNDENTAQQTQGYNNPMWDTGSIFPSDRIENQDCYGFRINR